MNFSDNLRKIRIEKNMSQQKLAEKAGLSQTAIYQLEKGTRKPKIETIQKIALALGVNIYDLDNTVIDLHKSENWFNHLKEELNRSISRQEEIFEKISYEELSKEEISKYVKQLQEFISQEDFTENQIDTLRKQIALEKELNEDTSQILSMIALLNNPGRKKAIEQVELLTKIPEYRKDEEE